MSENEMRERKNQEITCKLKNKKGFNFEQKWQSKISNFVNAPMAARTQLYLSHDIPTVWSHLHNSK